MSSSRTAPHAGQAPTRSDSLPVLVEQRDEGPRRVNRLRRAEFDARFPGLLELVLRADP